MHVPAGTDAPQGSFPLVIACFVLSGFAALLYQTVWTREFAFVFGTSELAVATVLAAYMAGLSAGAAVAGRLAPRVRRPVRVYAVLELGIGAAALAVPFAIAACVRLAVALFGGAPEPPDAAGLALPAFYLVASFGILMVPTALMGATLPLLARHAVRTQEELGQRIAVLYAANTAGAVVGTVCAAFLLLPALGLRATVAFGVAVNAGVFGLAALIARRAPVLPPAAAPDAGVARLPARRAARVLPLVLVSGAVSFVYEVLWTRLLGHVLGGSVHAFATMLATFLLGIALGSALASRRAGTPETAARSFAAAQIGIALASFLAYLGVDALPALAQAVGAGAKGGLGAGALLAGAVLLPSTLFIGATFPLAVRALARDARDAASASARVYAWNTLGAIVGAVGGGFLLIPALGYADTVLLCVASGLVLALAAALALAREGRRTAMVAALLLLALAVVRPGEPTTLLRTSPLQLVPMPGEFAFLGVGRSATVVLLDNQRAWHLRTNGLPESRIVPAGRDQTDELANHWMGSLPTLARPEAESLLFVGLGGGRQLESVSPSLRRIDVIELEPEVVAANRAVAHRRDPDRLADPRLRIHTNDARGALLLTDRRWDAIVSQPSHPWTAGAAHLYTREFFELVREHLTPGGVFVQWIGLTFVDEPLLRSLVATLNEAFPHVRVFRPARRETWLFLASEAPLPVESNLALARRFDAVNLDSLGMHDPEDLAAQAVLDARGTRRFAEGAAVVSDDRNLLQMGARRALRNPAESDALDRVLAPLDPLVPPADLDPLVLVRRLLDYEHTERAERVATSVADPRARRIALALVEAQRNRPAGEAALRAILTDDPGAVEAREALVLLLRPRIAAGAPEARALAAELDPPARAVVEGWRLARQGEWSGLAALEPQLVQVAPRDTLYLQATTLRIRWRLEAGDRRQAGEAVRLADLLLGRSRRAQYRVLRAWALATAGRPEPALGDLEDLAYGAPDLHTVKAAPTLAAGMRRALAEMPRTGALAARRSRLEARVAMFDAGGRRSPGASR